MTRKLTIGITLNIEADPTQSIWYNGGNQHCVFLAMALKRLPEVGKVWLCHNPGITAYPPGMMLDAVRDDLVPLHDVIHDLDLLIEMNSSIGDDHVAAVRERGGRIVSYRFGNDYVMTIEGVCFGTRDWKPNTNRIRPDQVWTNPQHAPSCKGFFEEVWRAPVKILPHLWSPHFIETALAREPGLRERWGYRPRSGGTRIGIFEPNLNVVKSSVLPMLICDRLYRQQPDLISHVYVTNSEKLKENPPFAHVALGLDLVQAGKMTFEARYPFCAFASTHVDTVVAHQWENALNYLYFEALYGGYPLIHNSPMLGKAGYRYNDFEVGGGASVLASALTRHDTNLARYHEQARSCLATVDPAQPPVLAAYSKALSAVMR